MTADKDPGQIITFYSYKGGTGRSMALANVAWILAANGARVLVIDWDLEAPGLHRYFSPFLTDPDLLETKGLIDTFWDMTAAQVARVAAVTEADDDVAPAYSGKPDEGDVMEAVAEAPPAPHLAQMLLKVTRRLRRKPPPPPAGSQVPIELLDHELFPGEGCIDLIGAGRQGGTYSERVNTFDWRGFYELGGADMLRDAAEAMRFRYDWVLIDSRTGVSDTSGICTMQMPDKVVACFTLNRQSTSGVSSVLGSIRAWRASRPALPPITFFPVAMRIENAEKDKLEAARLHARALLRPFLPEGDTNPEDYWNRMEVVYRPWYAYEETLAPFGDQTGAARTDDSLLAQMEKVAETITAAPNAKAGRPRLRAPEIPPDERADMLRQFGFGNPAPAAATPAAARTDAADPLDQAVLRGIYRKEQLWRQNNRNYLWLLSRAELRLLTETTTQKFGQSMRNYVESSWKIHLLLESNRRVFAFISIAYFVLIVLGIGFVDLLILSNPFGFFSRMDTALFIVEITGVLLGLALLIFMAIWLFAGLIIGHRNMLGDRPPDGLTVRESVRMSLRGPFQPTIPDRSGPSWTEDTPTA